MTMQVYGEASGVQNCHKNDQGGCHCPYMTIATAAQHSRFILRGVTMGLPKLQIGKASFQEAGGHISRSWTRVSVCSLAPTSHKPSSPALQSQEEARGPLRCFTPWERQGRDPDAQGAAPEAGTAAAAAAEPAPYSRPCRPSAATRRPASGPSGPGPPGVTHLPMAYHQFKNHGKRHSCFHVTDTETEAQEGF